MPGFKPLRSTDTFISSFALSLSSIFKGPFISIFIAKGVMLYEYFVFFPFTGILLNFFIANFSFKNTSA